jgi:hypothetical protein
MFVSRRVGMLQIDRGVLGRPNPTIDLTEHLRAAILDGKGFPLFHRSGPNAAMRHDRDDCRRRHPSAFVRTRGHCKCECRSQQPKDCFHLRPHEDILAMSIIATIAMPESGIPRMRAR